MSYLIDSEIAISYLKGQKTIVVLLHKLERKLSMSVISVAEILDGIYGQPQEKLKLLAFKDFLSGVKIIEVNEKIAQQFAIIRSQLRTKGQLIDNFDLLIAATAVINKSIFVTGNRKHFQKIKGLKISDVV